jgi:uncharacterized membrane protein required for colicin V production
MSAPINWLDAVIILALIGGMFVGFWQGIVRQAVFLTAFYAASVISTRLYPNVAFLIMEASHGMVTTVADVIGFFVLLFVVGLVMVFLTLDTLRRFTDRPVGGASHAAGAVAGLIGTAVFIAIALVALSFATLTSWPPSSEGARQVLVEARLNSNLVPVFRQLIPVVIQSIRVWGGNMPPLFGADFGV